MRRARCLLPVLLGLAACGEPAPPDATTPAQAPALAAASATLAADRDRGHALYVQHCSACHDAGAGHPGTMRLALRSGEAQAVLIARTDLTPAYVTQIVRQGLQMMPPFRPSEIGDSELVELAAFVATREEVP